MASISLQAGIRANLVALQSVSETQQQIQARLGSGRKVASPVDNPDAFFTASNLTSRAGDLAARLDHIAQGVKTLRAASAAVASLSEMLVQARGLAEYARALPTDASSDRQTVARDFNTMVAQADLVVKDAKYDGINLLLGESLVVEFAGVAGESSARLDGFDATSGGSVVTIGAQDPVDWSTDNAAIESAIEAIKSSVRNLEIQSLGLDTNLGVLTSRRVATEEMVDILKKGAADLTNADTEAETAAYLANASRQSFALRALTLSSESTQSVLRLFA